MHGGVAKEDLGKENIEALKKGIANLARHVENVKTFGVPPVVAINRFVADTDAELARGAPGLRRARRRGDRMHPLGRWRRRHRGAGPCRRRSWPRAGRRNFTPLYPDDMPLWDKVRTIAQTPLRRPGHHRRQEGARPVRRVAEGRLRPLPDLHGQDPVQLLDRSQPQGRALATTSCRSARCKLSAGAEFLVVICGEIMTMPGLPKVPAANSIFVNTEGQVEGLF